MTIKEKVAKAVAVVSLKMAKVSCGAASQFGLFQPKEPAALKKMMKNK